MSYSEPARIRKLGTLFRRTVAPLQAASEDRLVVLDAATMDISTSATEIYDRIVPMVEKTNVNGKVELSALLDLLMDLKTEFEHIQHHLTEALPVIEELMENISASEALGDTRERGSKGLIS